MKDEQMKLDSLHSTYKGKPYGVIGWDYVVVLNELDYSSPNMRCILAVFETCEKHKTTAKKAIEIISKETKNKGEAEFLRSLDPNDFVIKYMENEKTK